MAKPTQKNSGTNSGSNPGLLKQGGAPAEAAVAPHEHAGEMHRTLVVHPGLWKNPKARAKFRAVVKDLQARVKAPEQSAALAEVVYQWCVVDGRGFWCVCETVIVGGVPKIICHEVVEP